MAATGFTPIQLYRTATASAVPTAGNLADGELAINTNDGRLFYKDSGGAVQTIGARLGTNVATALGTAVGSAGAFVVNGGALGTPSSGTLTNATGLPIVAGTTGTLTVARGGTGLTTLTANNVILGNGTSTPTFVAPGTSGNVLTSNGTTWVSQAAGATLSGVTQSVSPFETALGFGAGNVTTGASNTWIGYTAGTSTTTGANNTAVGSSSMFDNTTGGSNTAVGVISLGSNTTASFSTSVGYGALYTNNANHNTAVGYQSGYQITSGTQNVLIGSNAGYSGTNNLDSGSNNIIIGYNAAASSASVSNEVTIGNTSITSTRLRGMVELNAAMFEAANISATAATGTINFDARTQSVLYYTSNASANWTLNIRAASGVSLDSVMTTGESMTVAFLVTNGATAYYQTGFQIDGTSVTPRWQGGTAPTAGNASSIDAYVITVIKTGAATFVALASQTRFA